MFYTYVLINKDSHKTYTGHTRDLEKRIKEHNDGLVKSSKKYRPYQVLLFEKFDTINEAKKREMYYKNFRGRQKLKEVIDIN